MTSSAGSHKRWPHVDCLLGLLLLAGLTLVGSILDVHAASQPVRGQGPAPTPSEVTGEITLSATTRYAVVLHEPGRVRTVHTRNDILFDPRDPMRSFTILQVDVQTVTLREKRNGRTFLWQSGTSPEGLHGLVLAGTVMLNKLRYRYKTVERVTQVEPVLVALEGSVAVLEKEVLRQAGGPAQATVTPGGSHPSPEVALTPSPTLSALLHAKEIDADTYEMEGATLRPALENLGQALSDLKVMVSPTLSAQSGIGFNVSSAVADGMLNEGGFTVTNSRAAQFFGIQVGDTVLRINDNPVTSPLNAWWAYQEFVARNPTQSDVRVDIRREGSLMTKTFRIR